MPQLTTSRQLIGIGETLQEVISNEVFSLYDDFSMYLTPGGSTLNSLISLGRAGIPSSFISEVGTDGNGENVTSFMERNLVSTDYVLRREDMETSRSTASLNEYGDAEYKFFRSPAFPMNSTSFPTIHANDIVLFGSYYAVDRRRRKQVTALLDYAREQGALIIYDINYRPTHQPEVPLRLPALCDNLAMADIVRGSKDDFTVLFGITDAEEIYREKVSPFCTTLLFTAGAGATRVFTPHNAPLTFPTPELTPVSTIGAGDNFNAGVIYAIIKAGITREMLHSGLTDAQWRKIIIMGQRFAADSCMNYYNFISPEFAEAL